VFFVENLCVRIAEISVCIAVRLCALNLIYVAVAAKNQFALVIGAKDNDRLKNAPNAVSYTAITAVSKPKIVHAQTTFVMTVGMRLKLVMIVDHHFVLASPVLAERKRRKRAKRVSIGITQRKMTKILS
jgi:hypothetical protein